MAGVRVRMPLPKASEDILAILENRNTRDTYALEKFEAHFGSSNYGDLTPFDWLKVAIRGQHLAVMAFIMNKAVFDDKQHFEALDYCVRNFTWPLAKAMRDAGTPWVSPDGVSSALYTAVQLRVHDIVLSILAHGGDGTFLGVSKDTLVHVALNNYDKKMLKILLDTSSDHPANVDLGALDGNGYTAANLAVGLGNAEILALIIADERADLTKANKEGNIPLHTAIRLQRSDMVTMLLVRDSPQFTTDDQGYTPMHIAVDVGDMQIMKILWEFNTAKIMPPDDCQTVESPLFTAVRKNRLPEYKLLRTMTKNYAAVNAFGESCLYLVVSRGMDDFLEYMIAEKDELNTLVQIKRPEGFTEREICQTALHTAVANGRPKTLKLLLAAGADTKKVNDDGASPLMLAVQLGYFEMVIALMQHGSSLIARDRRGRTVLTHAARTNSLEMVKTVAMRGINLDAVDGHEGTMLHYAIKRNNLKIVKYLLSRSANLEVVNSKGISARSLARSLGDPEILAAIAKHDNKPATPRKRTASASSGGVSGPPATRGRSASSSTGSRSGTPPPPRDSGAQGGRGGGRGGRGGQ